MGARTHAFPGGPIEDLQQRVQLLVLLHQVPATFAEAGPATFLVFCWFSDDTQVRPDSPRRFNAPAAAAAAAVAASRYPPVCLLAGIPAGYDV